MRENLIDPLYQRWRLQPITGKANRIASHSRIPNGEGAEVRYAMLYAFVCTCTYVQVVARDRWKGSQEGVFAPRQKKIRHSNAATREMQSVIHAWNSSPQRPTNHL